MKVIFIEVPTMKTLQITFEDNLHFRAKEAAHKAKMTLGDFVRAAVETQVERLAGSVREARKERDQ